MAFSWKNQDKKVRLKLKIRLQVLEKTGDAENSKKIKRKLEKWRL